MGTDLFFIAHRGNLRGINEERGNTVPYIQEALDMGYHAEVDVWQRHDRFYLGHDQAEDAVEVDFLLLSGVWCHAKDVATMNALVGAGAHCFFQAKDDVVMTSHGYLWTHSACEVVTPRSILTVIEFDCTRLADVPLAAGICSDHVASYRERLEVAHA